ncbi:MAG: serine hydroxymethyltransferase [bacterium]
MLSLKEFDIEVSQILNKEFKRQVWNLGLIPSENYVSKNVLEAESSYLINKYAEGYPGKRLYSGCANANKIEEIAISRAKELFKAEHINVQPHSGSQANMAVYFAMLKPGDCILSLDLNCGGHLTHGSNVNFSGKFYNIVHYGLDKNTEMIDFAQVRQLAHKHKPKMIVTGASSYPRIIPFAIFKEIADEVNAYLLTDIAHIAGLIIAGEHPSPIPYADFITTTTHKTLRGPRGGVIMCKKKFAENIDKAIFPGIQGGPLMHIIAAKAVAFKEALLPEFIIYQKQIVKNAKILAKTLIENNFRLITGGTDNHLMVVDLLNFKITGQLAAISLAKSGIYVNKNLIPFDTKSSYITSGIRLGTPAVTTRGMKEKEMILIGEIIKEVLLHHNNEKILLELKNKVRNLCEQFPIYN